MDGHPSPPTVGTFEEYRDAPFERRLEWAKEADVGRVEGPEVDYHVVARPDYVQQVLVEESDEYRKPDGIASVYGDGLLGVSGEQWRHQRTAVQTAFRPARVRAYCDSTRTVAREFVAELSDGETIDAMERTTSVTLRAILRTLFGHERDAETIAESSRAVRNWFQEALTSHDIDEDVQSAYETAWETLVETIDRIVADEEGDGDGVVATLVEAGPESDANYTDERIRDEMITLLFSAHERTAATLTYALYLLAGTPEVERKLLAEFDDVLDGQSPTSEALSQLEYGRRVIDETMRIYCPSDAVFRTAITDTELGGYRICEGDVVCLSQWAVHRDERWWDDPTTFRPERFAGESDRPSFAYFPFGAGRHHCPGEGFVRGEALLVVATLLQEFSIERVTREFDVRAGSTVVPDEPVELTVRERA